MSEILLPGDPGQLAFIRAMADPETMKAAMEELAEAKSQAEAALAALHEQEQKNQALVAEANQRLADAAKMLQDVEARAAELDGFEARLREVNEALTAEKARFEDVRIQVRAGHADRDAELDARETMIAQDRGLLTAVQRDALEAARGNVAEEQRLGELRDALYEAIREIQAGAKTISAAIAKIG